MKNIKRKLTAFALLFFSLLLFLIQSMSVCVAFADSNVIEFEKTNVMDDLEGATINGKLFSTDLYNFDKTKETQVFSLVEYCYSSDLTKQENYNLYVYIYNPKNIKFVEYSDRHSIQMSFAGSDNYNKYPLIFLNKSEESFDGLFYKYKIHLSVEEKEIILNTLNANSRIYHISGIELLVENETNPEEFFVNTLYTYTGFAKGYGDSEINSLSYTKSDDAEVLSLNATPTFFRPNGANDTNTYTQDCLASVYFSVPNSILNKYGQLSAIDTEWLKARSMWGLVTGNKTFYDTFLKYVGMNCNSYTQNSNLGLVATQDSSKIIYNLPLGADYDYTEYIPYLSYLFFSGDFVDSADEYEVSSKTILNWMKSYHDLYDNYTSKKVSYLDGLGFSMTATAKTPYGGDLLYVDGQTYNYSRALFQSYDLAKTRQTISSNREYSLISTQITQNYWQRLFGDYSIGYTNVYNGIKAIHKVSSEDFGNTAQETCRNLYIGLNDFQDFYKFYNDATNNNETVFLFRYDVGEYSSIEVNQGTWDFDGFVQGLSTIDTNGYLFQSDVYLGLDFIDVTFDNGIQSFVLPVIATPIDAVSSATPPLVTTTDHDCKILEIILILILCAVFSWIINQIFPWLYPLLGKIIKGAFMVIWYIVSFKWLRDLLRWKKGKQSQQVVVVNSSKSCNRKRKKGKKKPSNYRR